MRFWSPAHLDHRRKLPALHLHGVAGVAFVLLHAATTLSKSPQVSLIDISALVGLLTSAGTGLENFPHMPMAKLALAVGTTNFAPTYWPALIAKIGPAPLGWCPKSRYGGVVGVMTPVVFA